MKRDEHLIGRKFHCCFCGGDIFLDEFAFEKHEDWKERRHIHRHLNSQSIFYYCLYCYEVWCGKPDSRWIPKIANQKEQPKSYRVEEDCRGEEYRYYSMSGISLR